MWLTVEHITRYGYDAPDQRGVHGASPEAAAPRRPALLLVRARHRASRGDRRRVPRPLRQHRPPFRPARGPREPVRHGAQRGVDDGRVRGRRADALAARPMGLPRPDALRRSRRPGDRGRLGDRNARRSGRGSLGADAHRPRRDDVRARDDERAHDRGGGARRRPRGLPGLRPRDDRRLPGPRHPCALRQRLPVRPARTAARASRTHGSTSTSATPGSRSTRRTTRRRPSATSGSASAATTPTSRRRVASTAALRRRRSRWRSPFASRSTRTDPQRADESRACPDIGRQRSRGDQ